MEDTVVHILNTVRGTSLSSVDRSECSIGLEMAQYFAKVLEVEPLDAQRVGVLEGPELLKANACKWVIERVKSFCHVVGLSYEDQMVALF